MELKLLEALLFSVFLLLHIHSAEADLNSDEQALRAFASTIQHGHRLNWSSSAPVCSSWIGVKCTRNESRVISLRLPGMALYGEIPSSTLGKLDALQILSLRSNRIVGKLPSDLLSLPSLRYLYLQHNNLSGRIPSQLPSRLRSLELSYNLFSGFIPHAVQNLTELTSLNLENNSLSGPIPELDLPKLKHLNFSNNNLVGPIPNSLQKFPNSSFLGNSHLCGIPLEQCSVVFPTPAPASSPKTPLLPPKHKKLGAWAIIAISAGGFAVLLLLVIILLVCCLKKNGKKQDNSVQNKEKDPRLEKIEQLKDESSSAVQGAEKNKLVFFEGCNYNFDLEDLLRASAEVLGKGSFGTSYKATLEDSTTVMVKRLKDVMVGKKEFEQQMEIIGNVGQHMNVVPLRAYYYSKDERLLVADYVPSGSFSALLHGSKMSGCSRAPPDWDSRLKILIGAARGISHLHSSGGAKFAHGNIKSSNVLLSDTLIAGVSDFGLAPPYKFPFKQSSGGGYRAPELIDTRKPTHKSDVFSFGVLVLEALTGKPAISAAVQSSGKRDDAVDLPRWVQSVVREEWTAEVFDAELIKGQYHEEQMVQVLQIALACVARVPDQRPQMYEVVRMMEELVQNSGSQNSGRMMEEFVQNSGCENSGSNSKTQTP